MEMRAKSRQQLAAVFHKEILEGLRTCWIFIPVTMALIVMMQWFSINMLLDQSPLPAIRGAMLGTLMIYIPLMAMPFYGNMLLSKSLHEERLRGSIIPLLCTGVAPTVLWAGKLLAAFLLSYLVMLVSLGGYVLFVIVYAGQIPLITVALAFNILVIVPAFSLVVLAAIAFSFWLFKNALLVSLALPLGALFGMWNLSLLWGGAASISADVAGLGLLVSAMIVALFGLGVSKLSKERISGLY